MNKFYSKLKSHALVFGQKSGWEKILLRGKIQQGLMSQSKNYDGNIHATLNVKISAALFVISVDVFRQNLIFQGNHKHLVFTRSLRKTVCTRDNTEIVSEGNIFGYK